MGNNPVMAVSTTYSNTGPPLSRANCDACSVALTSSTTNPGSCAGASHFTSAELTGCAATTPPWPRRQNKSSPLRCRPVTLTTETPCAMPTRGARSVTTGGTAYSTTKTVFETETTSASAVASASAANPGARGGVRQRNVPVLTRTAGTGFASITQVSSERVSRPGEKDSETSPPPDASTRFGVGPKTS